MICTNCKDCFDFTMVGGSTEKLVFDAVTEYANVADLSGCTATFSICRYDERYADNAIEISDIILSGSTCVVNFGIEDTIDLHGKYIWQLTIYSPELQKLASTQGSLIIMYNINKGGR